jgi:O-antigen/teichoic acid export membrane protein
LILRLSRKILGKAVVQVACVHVVAGAGFSAANLILAWALPEREYGLVALVVALTNIGVGIGPLGLTGVVNRYAIRADRKLLEYGLVGAVITALVMTGLGYVVYAFSAGVLTAMAAATLAGSLTLLAAAPFQMRHQFVLSTTLGQLGNLGLAGAAITVLVAGVHSPLLTLFLIGATYAGTAAWSWRRLLRLGDGGSRQITPADWSDAISTAGAATAGLLLVQLERLLIPNLLSLESLATYGVVAAIALAPFRPLELAAGFTLLPRLRATSNLETRRRLLRKEAVFLGVLCVGGSLAIGVLTQPVIAWLYGTRLDIPATLVVAVIASGVIRVTAAVIRAATIAFCSSRQMWVLAWLTWVGVGLSVIGAVYGAHWGVTGIIYGISIGTAMRTLAMLWIAVPYYRVPK